MNWSPVIFLKRWQTVSKMSSVFCFSTVETIRKIKVLNLKVSLNVNQLIFNQRVFPNGTERDKGADASLKWTEGSRISWGPTSFHLFFFFIHEEMVENGFYPTLSGWVEMFVYSRTSSWCYRKPTTKLWWGNSAKLEGPCFPLVISDHMVSVISTVIFISYLWRFIN